MFKPGTIFSNFTPLVKSPVIGYRISGDDVLGILKKLTHKNFSKDHARIKLTKLYKKDGSILVPEKLRPYMNNLEKISFN